MENNLQLQYAQQAINLLFSTMAIGASQGTLGNQSDGANTKKHSFSDTKKKADPTAYKLSNQDRPAKKNDRKHHCHQSNAQKR